MSLIAVHDAAARLGVSTRQIQHLVTQGKITAPARGVVESESLDRYLVIGGGHRRRAWSMNTAWGAIAILSGCDAPWMGPTQRSRTKARLRSLTAAELVERSRERAEVTRFSGHPSALARVSDELVDTRAAAGRLGLSAPQVVDGYVAASKVEDTAHRYGLVRDHEGRFTLRATTFPIDVVRELADADLVLAALDLAESLDVRERHAGLRALTAALENLHG